MPAVYLCTNRVGPSHEGLELGVGDSILMKVGAAGRKLSGRAALTLLGVDAPVTGRSGLVAAQSLPAIICVNTWTFILLVWRSMERCW